MNVMRVGNQDNRTNFNGWIKLRKEDVQPIATEIFDRVILERISGLTEKEIDRVENLLIHRITNGTEVEIPSAENLQRGFSKQVVLKDKTRILYNDDDGWMQVCQDDEPRILGIYAWIDNVNSNINVENIGQKAKQTLQRLFNAFSNILSSGT